MQYYVYESLHDSLTPNPEILRFCLDLTNHHSFHSDSLTFKHYKGVLQTLKVEKINKNNPTLSKKNFKFISKCYPKPLWGQKLNMQWSKSVLGVKELWRLSQT